MAPLEPISLAVTLPNRATTEVNGESSSFVINARNKTFKHQYANIYFLRLRQLRGIVEERADKRWQSVQGSPQLVPRVLEVTKGQLCYIVGTIYMDMLLKPNILEDLARDHGIPAPPLREKYFSSDDSVALEDESGRIALVGDRISKANLVTGTIIAALGAETNTGAFEVIDMCFAGMPPQATLPVPYEPREMDVDDPPSTPDEWIALVSGLDIGSPTSAFDAHTQLLIEYLTGEGGAISDQISSAKISRLIIAGNSLTPPNLPSAITIGRMEADGYGKKKSQKKKSNRRYGYDSSSFSSRPTEVLNAHLEDIAQCMPVHLLPGESDPCGVILPQQPFPRAMFGAVSGYSSFTCETNPAYIQLSSPSSLSPQSLSHQIARKLLVHSGQPLDDMYRYLPSPPTTRLQLAAMTLQWRHIAPTAPDTLWCHPYFTMDPFILNETPDIYVIGCQPAFGTRLVVNGPDEEGMKEHAPSQALSEDGDEQKARCRIILVPKFAETGVLVLVNPHNLAVKTVQFAVQGMNSGENDEGGEDEENEG